MLDSVKWKLVELQSAAICATLAYMSPAELLIERFQGARAAARLLGVDNSRVVRWALSKRRGGTGGRIPSKHHKKILQVAAKRGIPYTAEEIIFGTPDTGAAAEMARG